MTGYPDFPLLDSAAKCAALWPKYPQKVVGLWATGLPRQNVDVLWRLREELLKQGVPTVFFFTESATPLLHKILAKAPGLPEDVYQLDESRFFRLLNFVDVLATHEYKVGYQEKRHIGAKLVSIPNHPNLESPCPSNYFYDYVVSVRDPARQYIYANIDSCKIDYAFYPDVCKIHRNPHFTQLVAGHSKIDLLLEERQKVAAESSPPILLLYPTYMDMSMSLQKISPEKYTEIWTHVVTAFLAWRPDVIVVFRPKTEDRVHPISDRLHARFANEARFFIDKDDDNKFWLARADYFVTDYSEGHTNFCLSAKKPSIRMVYSENEEEPNRDEWGWTIGRPTQVVPLLEKMDREENLWTESLHKIQERDMPTLGRNFALMAGMIKRIFKNDDDPAWFRVPKGHTPCKTSADLLKVVGKGTKYDPFTLQLLRYWRDDVLSSTQDQETAKVWLHLLKRALLPHLCATSPFAVDSLYHIQRHVNEGLNNTLALLPYTQTVGLLRHCLRKNASLAAIALLITASSPHSPGPNKKRALFFLFMEWDRYDPEVMKSYNDLAEKLPQFFSRPVLAKLNRLVPLAMKVPLPLRRLGALLLGIKKPLARQYWRAHRALS